MQTERIVIDRDEARDLYRTYKKHQHYSEPIDHEIQRAYQLIAQGRMVIRAVESIARAGLNAQGLPKLAICRATAERCWFYPKEGGGQFSAINQSWARRNERHGNRIHIPRGTWSTLANQRYQYEAIVPMCPLHLRPKRGLDNYHTLWEAEWTRIVPKDPMLLRQIGNADMWLVVAAWDLTEVERAALATRLSS